MTANVVSPAPLGSIPTVFAGADLTTVVKKVTLDPDEPALSGRARRRDVMIYNPNTTNTIAWQIVPTGDAAPTIVATFGANAGVHVGPGLSQSFTLNGGFDLYIVGDAAGPLSYSVASAITA